MTGLAPYYRRRAEVCRQKAAATFFEREKADWLRLAEQVDPPMTKRASGSRDTAGQVNIHDRGLFLAGWTATPNSASAPTPTSNSAVPSAMVSSEPASAMRSCSKPWNGTATTGTDSDGQGVVTEERLYQLVRQGKSATDRGSRSSFSIPASKPSAETYWVFAGAPGSTAATPSGLMLKVMKVSGSLPGSPHWCTRSNGS